MSAKQHSSKTEGILRFIQDYNMKHGFGPTIREIAVGVGLGSTSTANHHLTRMTREGLIASTPGIPRSIHVVTPKLRHEDCSDGSSILCCKFRFPQGVFPVAVFAMTSDDNGKAMLPVQAEHYEILRSGTIKIEGMD